MSVDALTLRSQCQRSSTNSNRPAWGLHIDMTAHFSSYPRRHSRRRGYRAFSRVCPFVCSVTGKRLELSTLNFVHVYSIAIAQHALTQKSKGQKSRSHGYENRHGRTVASDACFYGRCRRGSTCQYDCLCFLVSSELVSPSTSWIRKWTRFDQRRMQIHVPFSDPNFALDSYCQGG